MNKKYTPLLFLIAAMLLFYWVKKNQQGEAGKRNFPVENTGKNRDVLNRSLSRIEYSKHARCRMDCRDIDEAEVKEIWQKGVLNERRIEKSSKGISYPLEGLTQDGQRVRIVFAPKEDKVVVVTVIDLENDPACACD